MEKASSISKFYQKSREERLALLTERAFLSEETAKLLFNAKGLSEEVANHLIENQISQFTLPMGVALNFIVDGEECLIPMVTEEPSVIAACSNAARFTRATGGFKTSFPERLQTGQMIFYNLEDFSEGKRLIEQRIDEIKQLAQLAHPSIVARGGGLVDLKAHIIYNEKDQAEYLTVYLFVDVKEAMGANIVNTILEGVTPVIQEWLRAEKLMSILSNYNDRALVSSSCSIPFNQLATKELSGDVVAEKIVKASHYAKLDPYRAVTHNKGMMNGIDAVVMATGNDTRAIEAGIHAYAAKDGRYQGLTNWYIDSKSNCLIGELTLPLLLGSLGGAINALPLAKASQELLQTHDAEILGRIICSVGLAQNFAAIRALVTEGIQKGHMSLHASALAIHAGAVGDEIEAIASQLRLLERMNLKTASDLLTVYRQQNS
ncbi:hydroxymethylglutaryl-CoA reductase, degradative [Vagococcus xieshaowenii]|uniref:3-hydroxy-3-methylglutaryl coenzyme A reductase n=1 Tax=Vagococcus xieshaowenii TaxID=2562451 RepID=A0AAJ5EDS5_9ENTE|nr:hydroxymethylglutaryl-CoA reductase, degradative [Vagococcus xieshaowenii]QCA28667.1 hydroxymethylglutaryl-CoA reductase, degradative [Vagococcus xieshaowenii]TFZ40525.1 hydroxymethylglutaryl-CoA reductase, degradative [Vagococcus xieshaowenii]